MRSSPCQSAPNGETWRRASACSLCRVRTSANLHSCRIPAIPAHHQGSARENLKTISLTLARLLSRITAIDGFDGGGGGGRWACETLSLFLSLSLSFSLSLSLSHLNRESSQCANGLVPRRVGQSTRALRERPQLLCTDDARQQRHLQTKKR